MIARRSSLLTLTLAARGMREIRQRPPAGLGRGRLRVRRAGRGRAGRDARVREGDTDRGRCAAVLGRWRICSRPTCTPPPRRWRRRARGLRGSRPRSSARKRSRCCKRRRSARSRPSRFRPAELERQQQLSAAKASPRRRSSISPRRIPDRDQAALEEVRRQITVAQLASRDEDIAAARQSLAARKRGAERCRDQADAAQARVTGERRGAADLLPAGRDGAGRPAGGRAPAARQHQGALLRRRSDAAEDRALATRSRSTCDGCASRSRREGQLHLAHGRIHAAGDLQPGGAQQARVPDRGAHRHAGRPARRPAGERRACAEAAK